MGFGALDKTSLAFGTVTDKIQGTSSGKCGDIAAGDDGLRKQSSSTTAGRLCSCSFHGH